MARITVEDCLERVPNRFALVLVAAERAKQLIKGSVPLIEDDRENKEIVTALREIAAGVVQPDLSTLEEYDPTPADLSGTPPAEEPLPPEADAGELPPEAGD